MSKDEIKLPESYEEFLEGLTHRVSNSQLAAGRAVNRELVRLYWDLGREIVLAQESQGWGKRIVEQIADDLRVHFPDKTGFSRANVFRMRAFYLVYSKDFTKVAQLMRQMQVEMGLEDVAQNVRQIEESKSQQPSSIETNLRLSSEKLGKSIPVPELLANIPWGHNITLTEKVASIEERIWYAAQTLIQGWSRSVLIHQIDSGLYQRKGNAITNFQKTLPAPQSDLASELIKSPYNFGFLGLGESINERQLEQSLVGRLKDFLLELGKGFAFVGQQYQLHIGDQDYFIDLLFYHLDLRCFVVVDLKVESFKPEFAGKMSFYLSAVDDKLAKESDAPSIGLLLCKDHNEIIVEYTLKNMEKPLGVASYQLLPESVKSRLPSPTDLQRQMQSALSTNSKSNDAE